MVATANPNTDFQLSTRRLQDEESNRHGFAMTKQEFERLQSPVIGPTGLARDAPSAERGDG
jgi:hypothetical protein